MRAIACDVATRGQRKNEMWKSGQTTSQLSPLGSKKAPKWPTCLHAPSATAAQSATGSRSAPHKAYRVVKCLAQHQALTVTERCERL